jgi:hypothetical protein
MKPSTIAARLMERLRASPARDTRDWADYGTAFALDLSIEARPEATFGPEAAGSDASTWWSQLSSQRPAPGL